MADVHTSKIRSYNMSRIRSKNTKPEIIVRKYLYGAGIRYRLNVKQLPGKPDIVIGKYRIAIFINGCFWHGHNGHSCFVLPKTNTEWWRAKIEKTQARDLKHIDNLINMQWNVIVIWECQLKPKLRDATLLHLSTTISKIVLKFYSK